MFHVEWMPEALHKCKTNCKGASMKLRPYMTQLKSRAKRNKVDLKSAFLDAGVADSTYYRAMNGSRDLNFRTALKVADAIERLSTGNAAINSPV